MMTDNKYNIVFMGTPEFAVPTLDALHKQFGVSAVVTIPDKPQGRGLKLMPSPVKTLALELGLPVLQPESLKDEAFAVALAQYEPDIIVVVAFRILPEQIYSLSKIGTFNIHGSLLPKYRGAAPINWCIINGDKETGLTTFLLDKTVDTGNMLLQSSIVIPKNCTASDLHNLLMPISADIALKTCDLLISGDYSPLKQDDAMATPAPKLFPEKCMIDWTKPADELIKYIHGLSTHPGAWTTWGGNRLKIFRAILIRSTNKTSGTFDIKDKEFIVYCGSGALKLVEFQLQGKKAMMSDDFLRGYRGDKEGKFI